MLRYTTNLWCPQFLASRPIVLDWTDRGWMVEFGHFMGLVGRHESESGWSALGLLDEFHRSRVYAPEPFEHLPEVIWARVQRGDTKRIRLALYRLFRWVESTTKKQPDLALIHGTAE